MRVCSSVFCVGMWNTQEQLHCRQIYVKYVHQCVSPHDCPCTPLCVAGPIRTAGRPGKTCLSLYGTSLASMSPQGPQLCPEAGRLRGGTSSQGRPQAVSVHYCYIDGMWPAGGQTFTPYLLWSSAALFFADVGGCSTVLEKREKKEKVWGNPWLRKGSAYFTGDLRICDRFIEAMWLYMHIFKSLRLHIYTSTEILHLEEAEVLL